MTLRTLLKAYNYKKIFNILYKNYLIEESYKHVQNMDLSFYSSWNELSSIKESSTLNRSDCIYVSEAIDDLDDPKESFISVVLRNRETDELLALDFHPWQELIDLEIENATQLEDDEVLSEILWEITMWGYSQKEISKQHDVLKNSSIEGWSDVEKDLGDLYNGNEE